MNARKVEELYNQYAPLRRSLQGQYRKEIRKYEDREELKTFIDEQFVRLCYEYDVSGDMDFAGYIKTMLTMRVKYSFVGKLYRDNDRVVLGSADDIRGSREAINGEDDYSLLVLEFKEHLITSCKLDHIELVVLEQVLQEKNNKEIELFLRHYLAKHPNIKMTKLESRQLIRDIRSFLEIKIKEWLQR